MLTRKRKLKVLLCCFVVGRELVACNLCPVVRRFVISEWPRIAETSSATCLLQVPACTGKRENSTTTGILRVRLFCRGRQAYTKRPRRRPRTHDRWASRVTVLKTWLIRLCSSIRQPTRNFAFIFTPYKLCIIRGANNISRRQEREQQPCP